MKTSRQQLLEYIQQHRTVTAEDLSHALHMTQANVRHHLDILVERGLVEVTGIHYSDRKGRPARLFSPSESSLGNNLDLLSIALFQEADRVYISKTRESFIKRVADNMLLQIVSRSEATPHTPYHKFKKIRENNIERIENNDPRVGSAERAVPNLTQRLYRTIQNLNQLHYQARWEAHADAPRLILEHCPFLSVQDIHPEVCQIDGLLLAGLLRTDVVQIARLAEEKNGVKSCIFRVINR